jgi:hypothetical protein
MHAIRSRRTVLPKLKESENSEKNRGGAHEQTEASELYFADATIVMDSVSGHIVAVLSHISSDTCLGDVEDSLPSGCTFEDLGDLVVMPGLIDPYVSFGQNCSFTPDFQSDIVVGSKVVGAESLDPAEIEEWDGFEFGTKVSVKLSRSIFIASMRVL